MSATDQTVRVYRASVRDLAAVSELFNKYRQFYGSQDDPLVVRAFIAERFRQNDSVIYVGSVDDRVVGFAQLLPKLSSSSLARDWILNDLFVLEEARRLGVGRALIDEAKAFAQAADATKLTLKTGVQNEASQRLYEAFGWKRDDRFFFYSLPISGSVDGPPD
jgi:ribosomal protein S18 acetylase RimI-like enzyme